MKVNKNLVRTLVEKVDAKRAVSKRSRIQGRQQAQGMDDTGTEPGITTRDILDKIPEITLDTGRRLPAGKHVKGESEILRYVSDLASALGFHDKGVLEYADILDGFFDVPGEAGYTFSDQYSIAYDEWRVQEDQRMWSESSIRRIVRESLAGALTDSIQAQMDSIGQERADLQKSLEGLEDPEEIKKIADRIAQLDKASSEISSIEVEDPADDPDGNITAVEGKIRKADLLAMINEAQQELDSLQPVYDFGNKGEDIEAYDPMAVAAAETAIAVLGLESGMSTHELPLGGAMENEIYHALEAEGLTWDEERLPELGDQALSVAGILLGVGSKHF